MLARRGRAGSSGGCEAARFDFVCEPVDVARGRPTPLLERGLVGPGFFVVSFFLLTWRTPRPAPRPMGRIGAGGRRLLTIKVIVTLNQAIILRPGRSV